VDDHDRLARILARIYLALCILALAAMLIRSIPEHRMQTVRLWQLRSSARAMRALGRRAGVASMGRELATGEQLYGLPYWLARQADRLGAAYDRERGAV
jgi:hypothetical protein